VPIAFVAIKTEPGKEHDVYVGLQRVTEIAELHPLFGEYDLIAKIEASDLDVLGQVIVSQVRTLPGVLSTKTFAGTKR
jgi:DNA-binding Lrp family transcriptional regulator